ncbi:outer membrane beta-barrel protein [Danxiaibacter flavus]|uniref:Outer membrane beta-barrel protein n=1 Tax=Danxiaibacter flavus TaxID=3049108 RepID=A0ABV3ZEU8_9BACT|nr:outer membrane beta-barrel protein [Chitinophagaceae bacterium DXS]
MRSPLHNDDFESFLQKQVNQHRMYAADQIWRNIQEELHGKSRWPALTFTAIAVIALLVAGTLLVKPEKRLQNVELYARTHAKAQQPAPEKSGDGYQTIEERILPNTVTEKTIAAVKNKLNGQQVQQENPAGDLVAKVDEANLSAVSDKKTVAKPDLKNDEVTLAKLNNVDVTELSQAIIINNPANLLALTSPLTNQAIADEQLSNHAPLPIEFTLSKPKASSMKQYSFLQRLALQFYITPSSSYRTLIDDKSQRINSSYLNNTPLANTSLDANSAVKQKPAMGIEIGLGVGYNLSKRFMIKSGLQFNARQYNIEAYNVPTQQTSVGLGYDNVYRTTSSYSTTPAGSTSVTTIQNKTYELSLPIGADYRILRSGSGKVAWNVAASIQPTYTFDKEPFLLSTDLKNYADGTDLMRKWNFNSSIETYVSFQSGKYRWQIGPQFRYQVLPTYIKNYPIKEHLFDYGIKVGFSKRLK